MRVLVTVGTTPFPQLVRFADRAPSAFDITIQAAEEYKPAHAQRCFNFSDSIADLYATSDVIVTHAGAGTVFHLLERGHRICVVPNLDRVDPHQSEIAQYVRHEGFAFVADDISQYGSIDELVTATLAFSPKPYQRVPFNAGAAILRLFSSKSNELELPNKHVVD